MLDAIGGSCTVLELGSISRSFVFVWGTQGYFGNESRKQEYSQDVQFLRNETVERERRRIRTKFLHLETVIWVLCTRLELRVGQVWAQKSTS